jgi:hypothetical protein
MRRARRQWRGAVGALWLVLATVGGPVVAATAAGASSQELVYVATANSASPVTAYPVTSSGAVSPAVSIPNPNISGTVWDPWGVTFDQAGALYVQSFLSNATTFVYPDGTGAGGPSRTFMAISPDDRAIGVDGNGYEYIPGGESASEVAVAPPGAAGSVAPVRTFTTDQGSFTPWPDILTIDGSNNVVVAVGRASGNAIEIIAGGPGGSPTPITTIAGSATGLGTCDVTSCDQVSVAYSPTNGKIYAAVSSGHSGFVTHVSSFTETGGNVAPTQTIEGSATGLTGKVVTGIAVSGLTGDVFGMVRTAQFGGSGQVESWHGAQDGNVSPLASFTDASTGFANAEGIVVNTTTPGAGTPEVPVAPLLPLAGAGVAGTYLLVNRRRRQSRDVSSEAMG